jgi:hypothetical protein
MVQTAKMSVGITCQRDRLKGLSPDIADGNYQSKFVTHAVLRRAITVLTPINAVTGLPTPSFSTFLFGFQSHVWTNDTVVQ